jgi:hypothetical protein
MKIYAKNILLNRFKIYAKDIESFTDLLKDIRSHLWNLYHTFHIYRDTKIPYSDYIPVLHKISDLFSTLLSKYTEDLKYNTILEQAQQFSSEWDGIKENVENVLKDPKMVQKPLKHDKYTNNILDLYHDLLSNFYNRFNDFIGFNPSYTYKKSPPSKSMPSMDFYKQKSEVISLVQGIDQELSSSLEDIWRKDEGNIVTHIDKISNMLSTLSTKHKEVLQKYNVFEAAEKATSEWGKAKDTILEAAHVLSDPNTNPNSAYGKRLEEAYKYGLTYFSNQINSIISTLKNPT